MELKPGDLIVDGDVLLVCRDASDPTPFTDNVPCMCVLCGAALQRRPIVPERAKPVCFRCFMARVQPNDKVFATRMTVVELQELSEAMRAKTMN